MNSTSLSRIAKKALFLLLLCFPFFSCQKDNRYDGPIDLSYLYGDWLGYSQCSKFNEGNSVIYSEEKLFKEEYNLHIRRDDSNSDILFFRYGDSKILSNGKVLRGVDWCYKLVGHELRFLESRFEDEKLSYVRPNESILTCTQNKLILQSDERRGEPGTTPFYTINVYTRK